MLWFKFNSIKKSAFDTLWDSGVPRKSTIKNARCQVGEGSSIMVWKFLFILLFQQKLFLNTSAHFYFRER